VLSVSSRKSTKLIRQATFDSFFPISDQLVLFQMKQRTVSNTGCLLSAACIYSNSKLRLYEKLHELQQWFPRTSCIYIVTDGAFVKVPDPGNKLVTYFQANRHQFDFSRLDKSCVLYSTLNQNQPGIWRLVDLDIVSMICLRPKCYSVLRPCKCITNHCLCGSSENKNSGMRKGALRKLDFWYYLSVLVEDKTRSFVDERIKSVNHRVQLVKRRAVAFSTLNTSWYLLPDLINSRPFGFKGPS